MKKKQGGSAALIVGIMLLVGIAATAAVTQDWKTGHNSLIDYTQAYFGDGDAQYAMAVQLHKDKSRKDAAIRAQVWYERAAEKGHVRAMIALGDIYDAKGTETTGDDAVFWYKKAAATGNAEAMRKLAIAYAIGRGKLDRDPNKAMELIEGAAKKGDVDAEYLYGLNLFENGQTDEGIAWMNKAAGHGKSEADYKLGKLYSASMSPIKDMKKAFTHFGRASEAGHWEAQLLYSFMYFNGIETKADLAEAYKWALLASDSKEQRARNAQQYVERYLTPEQKAEGEARAKAWRATHKR